jgi:putative DNA primase/helicase
LNWHGTATEFLEEVGKLAGTTVTRSAGWPKTPRALMNEMRRIAPQLRSRGLFVSFDRTREKRVIVVRNQIWQDRFGHT